MILSMTAYARREADIPAGRLTWELRSVNSRFLEVSLRLPEDLRAHELRVREAIGARLSRGKVDAALKFEPVAASSGQLELDETVLKTLLEAANHVHRAAGTVAPLRMVDCLRWPGVVKASSVDTEGLIGEALALLGEALTELIAMRAREGERLAALIRARLDAMEAIVAEVKKILPETLSAFRERLLNRLAEVKQQLDPNRVEQEIALFANKSDVAEELDRLSAHFAEVRRTLAGGGQVGRRLDFLMQELNREANTLGSKSVDLRMTNASVELKVLIEQMREQVQNIE
jgi:uncharacterized protein (TIGR00255 family)